MWGRYITAAILSFLLLAGSFVFIVYPSEMYATRVFKLRIEKMHKNNNIDFIFSDEFKCRKIDLGSSTLYYDDYFLCLLPTKYGCKNNQVIMGFFEGAYAYTPDSLEDQLGMKCYTYFQNLIPFDNEEGG